MRIHFGDKRVNARTELAVGVYVDGVVVGNLREERAGTVFWSGDEYLCGVFPAIISVMGPLPGMQDIVESLAHHRGPNL